MIDFPRDDRLVEDLRHAAPSISDEAFDPDDERGRQALEAILATSVRYPSSALRRRVQPRWRHLRRGRSAVVVGIAALVAVLALLFVPTAQRPVPQRSPDLSSPGRPTWRLAGDLVQPAWRMAPGTTADPYFLACPSTKTCYATGPSGSLGQPNALLPAEVEVTNDGGATWHATQLPGPLSRVSSLTCPTVTTCMVLVLDLRASATTLYSTSNGGRSWTTHPVPGSTAVGSLVSCPTATHCVLLGGTGGPDGVGDRPVPLVTTDGGATWSTASLPSSFRAVAIDCPSAARCVAGGYWTPAPGAPASITQVTTPGALLVSTNGGSTWSAASAPPGGNIVTAISCADVRHCVALENSLGREQLTKQVLRSVDGGKSWTSAPGHISATLRLGHVACPSANQCWFTGATAPGGRTTTTHGVIISTGNGGRTFRTEPLPNAQGQVLPFVGDVSCPSVRRCTALAVSPSAGATLGMQIVLSYG